MNLLFVLAMLTIALIVVISINPIEKAFHKLLKSIIGDKTIPRRCVTREAAFVWVLLSIGIVLGYVL